MHFGHCAGIALPPLAVNRRRQALLISVLPSALVHCHDRYVCPPLFCDGVLLGTMLQGMRLFCGRKLGTLQVSPTMCVLPKSLVTLNFHKCNLELRRAKLQIYENVNRIRFRSSRLQNLFKT